MNILLISEQQWQDAEHRAGKILLKLDARQTTHCYEVLRVKAGDTLQIGLINGGLGVATIAAKAEAPQSPSILIELETERLDQSPPEPSGISLHTALARPKMMRRMLRVASELGIKEIHIFNCEKVEKSYWQSPLLSPDKITQALIEGLEQAKDTVLPVVHLHKRFRPFVEDSVPEILNGDQAWVAHPYGGTDALGIPHLQQELTRGARLHLFMGPEGGFHSFELNRLQRSGARLFTAGERIMRCETFLPWILGSISHKP